MNSICNFVAVLMLATACFAQISKTTGAPGSVECNALDVCDHSLAGEYVADPDDCHRYYACGESGPIPDSLECRDGMFFNETLGDCQNEGSVYRCLPRCGPPADYCGPTICPVGSTNLTYVAHPTNCSMYYICNPGAPAVFTCTDPAKPYFHKNDCQANEDLCCDPCTPYCTQADIGTEIRDPRNCYKYYFCDVRGYPTKGGECQTPGEVFDPQSRECDKVTCEQYCPAQ